MQPKVVFLHARNQNPETSFYKSVGEVLEQNNFQVKYLRVENSEQINNHDWIRVLEDIEDFFDAETYIVAHSIGVLAVMVFLSKRNIKIKALHAVGGVFATSEDSNQFSVFDLNTLNFPQISQNCEFIYLHHSKDDPRVDYEAAKKYKQVLPKAQVYTYYNRGHFIDLKNPVGKLDFSELSNLILNLESVTWTLIEGKKHRVKLLETKNLPLLLPEVEDYLPSQDGRSPLAKTDWIKIKNEQGKIIGKHESDTMPNWAGSSWYYLRYIDPVNPNQFASYEKMQYWLPVDLYFGGSEHTTVHLLYSRFWHKFLYDLGEVPTPEPYQKRINGGILLGPDGSKMSKSKGNVINIKEKISQYGADAVRLYIAFIGPYEATAVWSDGGLKACGKLVDTIFKLAKKVEKPKTKYFIFDFDGTLADNYEAGLQTVMQTKNITYEEAKIYSDNYLSSPKHSKKNNLTLDELAKASEVVQTYSKIFKKIGFQLFQDFIKEIGILKNTKLAVVSSGSENYVKPYLKETDLEFSHILCFEDHHSKEEKISRVCKDWGVDKDQVYYFTDTMSDVIELRDYLDPKKIIGCSWGHQGKKRLQEVLPDQQIMDNFKEIHLLEGDDYPLSDGFLQEYLEQAYVAGLTPNIHLIIQDEEGKLLAQHRRADRKVFPDLWEVSVYGKIEPNESIKKAIKREFFEETGFQEFKILKLLNVLDWDLTEQWKGPLPKNLNNRQRTFSFLVSVPGKQPKPKLEEDKADNWRWVSENDLKILDKNIELGETWTKDLAIEVLERQRIDFQKSSEIRKLESQFHKYLKNITEEMQDLKNNVAVAEIMTMVNSFKEVKTIPAEIWSDFLRTLAPFAPHTAEELWQMHFNISKPRPANSVHLTSWPDHDPILVVEEEVTLAVQINGKVRTTIQISKESSSEEILNLAKQSAKKWLEGKEITFSKVIPEKLVSLVTKNS